MLKPKIAAPAPPISASCPETHCARVWRWQAVDSQLHGHSQPTSSSTAGHTPLPMLFQNRKFYDQATVPVHFPLPLSFREHFREAQDSRGAQKLFCSGDMTTPFHRASEWKFTCQEDLQHQQDPFSASLCKGASSPHLHLPSFAGRPLIRICPPEVS